NAVPLSEVLKRSDEWIEIRPEERYREVTVRLWGNGVVLRREVSGAEIAASRRLMVRAGQFILSRIDARNGALGLVPEALHGAVVSNDFPVFEVHRERLSASYLVWLSRTGWFVDLCRSASEGTTNRVRLKEERFLASEIPLPPLEEQQRIVARIEELAAKVEEARGLRQRVQEQLQALVASLHLSLAGERRVRIGDILILDEEREPVVAGRQYPQVGIKGFGQGLFARETLEASETTYKAFNRLYAGALMLSQVKGWEGAIAVCRPELAGRYASPEYRTFRCKPGEALSQYLSALVATPWFYEQLAQLTRGVGARRERIRPERFLEMEIPMPTADQQRLAITIVSQAGLAAPLFSQTVTELDALLPSILDKAFRGEL
ncbi:MAG: restriction endonuclease subunit S, partial [Gemmatimonadetes bacterium]|nr:restriction endonuclease subunit S [Gemmatimonadota bacterium]